MLAAVPNFVSSLARCGIVTPKLCVASKSDINGIRAPQRVSPELAAFPGHRMKGRMLWRRYSQRRCAPELPWYALRTALPSERSDSRFQVWGRRAASPYPFVNQEVRSYLCEHEPCIRNYFRHPVFLILAAPESARRQEYRFE